MADAGARVWAISRELGMSRRDVERAIARERLRDQVQSGSLKIRRATRAEMKLFAQQRERHDRAALEDRDRLLKAA